MAGARRHTGECLCTPDQIACFRGRVSGPLLNRIDLPIFVPRVRLTTRQ
ncbi:ATP-binding protein [Hydrocarboniphaga sp.]|nr:ATP-binding protein [Hydrocarboniphaga sp.]